MGRFKSSVIVWQGFWIINVRNASGGPGQSSLYSLEIVVVNRKRPRARVQSFTDQLYRTSPGPDTRGNSPSELLLYLSRRFSSTSSLHFSHLFPTSPVQTPAFPTLPQTDETSRGSNFTILKGLARKNVEIWLCLVSFRCFYVRTPAAAAAGPRLRRGVGLCLLRSSHSQISFTGCLMLLPAGPSHLVPPPLSPPFPPPSPSLVSIHSHSFNFSL